MRGKCHSPPPTPALPLDGAENVPRNTLLWGGPPGVPGLRARLFGPEGEVALEARFIPTLATGRDGAYPVWQPLAPLLPNAQYRVELEADRELDRELDEPIRTFTTGAAFDESPPASPRLELAQVVSHSPSAYDKLFSCEPVRDVILDVRGEGLVVGDVATDEGGWVLDAGEPAFGPSGDPVTWIVGGEPLRIGDGGCSERWPGSAAIATRFGSLDLAGNFSGWTLIERALSQPDLAEAGQGDNTFEDVWRLTRTLFPAPEWQDLPPAESVLLGPPPSPATAEDRDAELASTAAAGSGCRMSRAPGSDTGSRAAHWLAAGLVALLAHRRSSSRRTRSSGWDPTR